MLLPRTFGLSGSPRGRRGSRSWGRPVPSRPRSRARSRGRFGRVWSAGGAGRGARGGKRLPGERSGRAGESCARTDAHRGPGTRPAAPPPPSRRLPAPSPRAPAILGRGGGGREMQLPRSPAFRLGWLRGSASLGLGLGTPGVPNSAGQFRRPLRAGWRRLPRMKLVAPPGKWMQVPEAALGRWGSPSPSPLVTLLLVTLELEKSRRAASRLGTSSCLCLPSPCVSDPENSGRLATEATFWIQGVRLYSYKL